MTKRFEGSRKTASYRPSKVPGEFGRRESCRDYCAGYRDPVGPGDVHGRIETFSDKCAGSDPGQPCAGRNVFVRASLVLLLVWLIGAGLSTATVMAADDTFWPDPAPAVDWDPVAEAQRLAADLLGSSSEDEIREVLSEILARIGIGIYTVHGQPIRVGGERGEDDFYLYDYEVELIAGAFLRERYASLESVVEPWKGMGLTVRSAHGSDSRRPVTASAVDRGLRALRLHAEEHPTDPRGFWIRLFDELGDRGPPHEFALLEGAQPDARAQPRDAANDEMPPEMAAGMREVVGAQLETLRRDAEAAGDEEMLEVVELLETEAGIDYLMQAMAEGAAQTLMDIFMGEASVEEIEAALDGTTADPSADTTGRAGLVAQTAPEAALEPWRAELDALREALDEQLQRLQERAARLRPDADPRFTKDTLRVLLDDSETMVAVSEPLIAWQEEELARAEAWNEEVQAMRALFAGAQRPDEEETSDLVFDAVQVLLLHIDLFIEPRRGSQTVAADRPHWDQWRGALATRLPLWGAAHTIGAASAADSGADSLCDAIGELEAEHPDLFGALNTAYEVADGVQSLVAQGRAFLNRTYAGAVSQIARGAVETVAMELDVNVEYHPEDARHGEGIHLPHGPQDQEEKYIGVVARVHSPLREVVAERVADIENGCGPIRHEFSFAQDDFSDIEIRFYPARTEREDAGLQDFRGSFLPDPTADFHARFLDARARDWERTTQPTFVQQTGGDGVAIGRFYLQHEEPDAGGQLRQEVGWIRVQAMMLQSASAVYNPAAWGLAIGEEIFRPVETWVPVWVEYHEPLPFEGSVGVHRTVVERGSAEGQQAGQHYEEEWNARVDLTITVPNLRIDFDESGASSIAGDYRVVLETSTWESRTLYSTRPCFENGREIEVDYTEQRRVERRFSEAVDGSTRSMAWRRAGMPGASGLVVDSARDAYHLDAASLAQEALGDLIAAAPAGQELTRIERTYSPEVGDCESEVERAEEALPGLLLPEHSVNWLTRSWSVPVADRPEFRREEDQPLISQALTWSTRRGPALLRERGVNVPEDVGNIEVVVETSVDWSLDRMEAEE